MNTPKMTQQRAGFHYVHSLLQKFEVMRKKRPPPYFSIEIQSMLTRPGAKKSCNWRLSSRLMSSGSRATPLKFL